LLPRSEHSCGQIFPPGRESFRVDFQNIVSAPVCVEVDGIEGKVLAEFRQAVLLGDGKH
jgi:hypothetical protein